MTNLFKFYYLGGWYQAYANMKQHLDTGDGREYTEGVMNHEYFIQRGCSLHYTRYT